MDINFNDRPNRRKRWWLNASANHFPDVELPFREPLRAAARCRRQTGVATRRAEVERGARRAPQGIGERLGGVGLRVDAGAAETVALGDEAQRLAGAEVPDSEQLRRNFAVLAFWGCRARVRQRAAAVRAAAAGAPSARSHTCARAQRGRSCRLARRRVGRCRTTPRSARPRHPASSGPRSARSARRATGRCVARGSSRRAPGPR